MRNILAAIILFVALTPSAAWSQDMLTQTTSPLLVDSSPSLNSSRQVSLASAVRGQPVNGVTGLPANTSVKVLNKAVFDKKETLHKAGDPMPKDVRRQFQAAYVEVADGPHQGKKGWIVISYQDPGEKPNVYLAVAPANHQQQQASQSNAAADLLNSIDLIVYVRAGHISPTGGRLYDVGVVNKGGLEAKGSFDVVVELDGKVIKTEKVRGPLKRDQSAAFTIPIGDKELRKGGTLKATVDPKNTFKESNESNNTGSAQLAP